MKLVDINKILVNYQAKIMQKQILGLILLVISTYMYIPTQPVPITLQSVAVLYIGLKFSKKIALSIVKNYITLGLLGLPVFTNYGSGLGHLFGPTGGYIIGFYLAIYSMSQARHLPIKSKILSDFVITLLGILTIYISGFTFLCILTCDPFVAFNIGVMPFVLPEIYKAIILVLFCNAEFKLDVSKLKL